MYATFSSYSQSVIYINYSEAEPSVEEFEEYLDRMKEILDNKQKTVLVFDSTATKYLSSDLRIRQGQWIKQNQEELKKYIMGGAFIIPSMVIRVVFNCILAIQKLPYPHIVVSNKEDALKWAVEKSEKALQPV